MQKKLQLIKLWTKFRLNPDTNELQSQRKQTEMQQKRIKSLSKLLHCKFEVALQSALTQGQGGLASSALLAEFINNLNPKALDYFLKEMKIQMSEFTGLSQNQLDVLKAKAAISKLQSSCGLFEFARREMKLPEEALFNQFSQFQDISLNRGPCFSLSDKLLRGLLNLKSILNTQARQYLYHSIQDLSFIREEQTGRVKKILNSGAFVAPLLKNTVVQVVHKGLGSAIPQKAVIDLEFSVDHFEPHTMNQWNQMVDGDLFFLVKMQDNHCNKVTSLRSVRVLRKGEGSEVNPLSFIKATKTLGLNHARIILVQLEGNQYQRDLERGKLLLQYDFIIKASKRLTRLVDKITILAQMMDQLEAMIIKLEIQAEKSQPTELSIIPTWIEEILVGDQEALQLVLPHKAILDRKMPPHHLQALLKRLEGFDLKDTLLSEKEFLKKIKQNALIAAELREFLAPSSFLNQSHREYDLLVENFSSEMAQKLPFRPRYQPTNYTKFSQVQVSEIVAALLPGLSLAYSMDEQATTHLVSLLLWNFAEESIFVSARTPDSAARFCKVLLQKGLDSQRLVLLCEQTHECKEQLGEVGVTSQIMNMLNLRTKALEKVRALALTLGISNFQTNSCDSASYLFTKEIQPLWVKFSEELEKISPEDDSFIPEHFPFCEFIRGTIRAAAQDQVSIFREEQIKDVELADFYWHQIESLFKEVKECEAYQIVQGNAPRVAHLLTKQASVVVSTVSLTNAFHSYLKEVVVPRQKIKTCIVLEADRYREEDLIILLNTLTTQLKVKQSVFEDEGRDELKQHEIERLVLVLSESSSQGEASFVAGLEKKFKTE